MPLAARDSLVSPLERRATANPVAAELLRKVRAVLPRHYPPVRDLRLGLDETIWIERHASTGAIFQMLDARGAAVLEVALPRGARLAQANRTHVWVVEHDDDGVPSVVRHRILARR
jgi:hypothetical protein